MLPWHIVFRQVEAIIPPGIFYVIIGINDESIEGTYVYEDDTAVLLRETNWKATQPDNFGNEDCTAMEFYAAWKWFDVSCTSPYRILCEKLVDC